MEVKCNNGGCTKPVYRGTECFVCWAGTKFDSMKQRVNNKRNYYPQWAGKTVDFTRKEFVKWAVSNPPPKDMHQPSVDRIDSDKGYSFENIRWLESRSNSRGHQKDVPLTHRQCFTCKRILELSYDNFNKNRGDPFGYNTYCRECTRERNRIWTRKRKSALV